MPKLNLPEARAALTDLSMTRYVTPTISGVLYAAGVALGAFVTFLVLLFELKFGAWVLIVWPVTLAYAAIQLVLWRVVLEFFSATVLTARSTALIAEGYQAQSN